MVRVTGQGSSWPVKKAGRVMVQPIFASGQKIWV